MLFRVHHSGKRPIHYYVLFIFSDDESYDINRRKKLTREEAREYLLGISWDMGSTAMDYWNDMDPGEKMREAISVLYECKEENE